MSGIIHRGVLVLNKAPRYGKIQMKGGSIFGRKRLQGEETGRF